MFVGTRGAHDNLTAKWAVVCLTWLALVLCIFLEQYLVLFLILVSALILLFTIKYDAGIITTLFLIPYSWGFATVGFFDLFDQKLSYLLFYALIFALVVNLTLGNIRFSIRDNPLFKAILVFLLVNIVAVYIAPNKLWGLKEYVRLLYLFGVFYVIYNFVYYSGNVQKISRILLWSTLSVAGLGLFQYATDITFFDPIRIDMSGWDNIQVTPYYFDLYLLSEAGGWIKRIGAVYVGSPNLEANFLIIGFFLSLTEMIYSQKRRGLYGLGFAGIAVAIVLTSSRGAWLGIIGSMIVLLSLTLRQSKAKGLPSLMPDNDRRWPTRLFYCGASTRLYYRDVCPIAYCSAANRLGFNTGEPNFGTRTRNAQIRRHNG